MTAPAPPPPPLPPPPPFSVVARIPVDQPFVVSPSSRKRALGLGAFTLVMLVILGCVLGLAGIGSDNAVGLFVLWFVLALLFIGLVGLSCYMTSSGGPVLAAGPSGMWVKTRPTRGQAIWLPWEAIEMISRRRLGLEKILVVKARDPRIGQQLGAFTAFDSVIIVAAFGSGFTATLTYVDRPEQEILQAVTYYAANRVALR